MIQARLNKYLLHHSTYFILLRRYHDSWYEASSLGRYDYFRKKGRNLNFRMQNWTSRKCRASALSASRGGRIIWNSANIRQPSYGSLQVLHRLKRGRTTDEPNKRHSSQHEALPASVIWLLKHFGPGSYTEALVLRPEYKYCIGTGNGSVKHIFLITTQRNNKSHKKLYCTIFVVFKFNV